MDTPARTGDCVVLDTNIVLDLFVFRDPAALPVRQALEAGTLDWVATQPMRDELERVLAFYKLEAADVLAGFDRHARLTQVAAKAAVTCSDTDDQKFIDLAVVHRAWLLSKDQAVLCMKKRLLALDVRVQTAINKIANPA
jgi:predicted nucleic acid-binding protein